MCLLVLVYQQCLSTVLSLGQTTKCVLSLLLDIQDKIVQSNKPFEMISFIKDLKQNIRFRLVVAVPELKTTARNVLTWLPLSIRLKNGFSFSLRESANGGTGNIVMYI